MHSGTSSAPKKTLPETNTREVVAPVQILFTSFHTWTSLILVDVFDFFRRFSCTFLGDSGTQAASFLHGSWFPPAERVENP